MYVHVAGMLKFTLVLFLTTILLH